MENLNEALLIAADDHSKSAVKEIKRLLRKGANIHYHNERRGNALLIAAWHGNEKSVAYLLKKGADPNFLDHEGANALHRCIDHSRNANVIKMLLKAGSSIHIKLLEPDYITQINKAYIDDEELKWNTTRTMLTRIDEVIRYVKKEKKDSLDLLPDCYTILDAFNERYKELLKEDQKIIQKYRLRKFFNMI